MEAVRVVDKVLTGNAKPPSATLVYATRVKATSNAEDKNPRRNLDMQMERITGRASSCRTDNVCSLSSASLAIATDDGDDDDDDCVVGPAWVGSVYNTRVSHNPNLTRSNIATDLI